MCPLYMPRTSLRHMKGQKRLEAKSGSQRKEGEKEKIGTLDAVIHLCL